LAEMRDSSSLRIGVGLLISPIKIINTCLIEKKSLYSDSFLQVN